MQLVQLVTHLVLEYVVKMVNITIQVQKHVYHVIHLVTVVSEEGLITVQLTQLIILIALEYVVIVFHMAIQVQEHV